MNTLLFFILFVVSLWFLRKLPFVNKAGLPFHWITILFTARVLAGLLLKWISDKYYPSNDYAFIQREAHVEFEWLMDHPKDFFLSIFHSPYDNAYGNFYGSEGSYWKDLANNLIIKLQAATYIVTRGHYAGDILVMNTFGFLGSVAIYRTYVNYFPTRKNWLIFSSFLIPTTLYFTSGIHKDLFIFTALCFLIYVMKRIIEQGFTKKRMIGLAIFLLSIALLRNFILACLVPCAFIYFITTKIKIHSRLRSILTITMVGILLITLTCLKPEWSPWKLIVERQHAFLALKKANSQLDMLRLENTCWSMSENLATAINHGFFRPYFWSSSNLFAVILGLELYLFGAIIGISLYQNRGKMNLSTFPVVDFSLLFAILMVISIGYIVPNSFSIARYRSIYLPFIITPFLSRIQFRSES